MILLCGIPSERPMAMVAEALEAIGARVVVLNQRAFADTSISFSVSSAGVTGTLMLGSQRCAVEDIASVYTRMMDDHLLPELTAEPEDSPVRHACRILHEDLWRWLDIAPSRVLEPRVRDGLQQFEAIPGAGDPFLRLRCPRHARHQ